MDIADFNVMLEAVGRSLPQLWGVPKTYLDLKEKKKNEAIDAFEALKNATHKTREHINKDGYVANTELSELWTKAYSAITKAKLFGESNFVYYVSKKGDFWSDPPKWLNEKSSMEMIPKLIDIDNRCEEILSSLTNK